MNLAAKYLDIYLSAGYIISCNEDAEPMSVDSRAQQVVEPSKRRSRKATSKSKSIVFQQTARECL